MSRKQTGNSNKNAKAILEKKRVPSKRHILKTVSVVLLVSVLITVFEYVGFFSRFETAALDTWLLLGEPLRTPHTIIVGITDDDYRKMFGETSPLDPEQVQSIIHAIASANPSVIGVDLDTSAEGFRNFKHSPSSPAIIWATGASYCDNEIKPLGVLGGREVSPSDTGLALMPQDSDSTIRQYRREFVTTDGSVPVASFPWAVVKAFCCNNHNEKKNQSCERIADQCKERQEKDWLLNVYQNPPSTPACEEVSDTEQRPLGIKGFSFLSASNVLRLSKGEDWRTEGPLRDKIVLLGGLYRSARDEYMTPSGPMPGVVILGQTIEAELQGKVIPKPNQSMVVLLNIFVGVGLAFLFGFFSHRLLLALGLSLFAIIILPVLCSFIISGSFALVGYFIPVLIAVLIQELYESANEYQNKVIEELYGHKRDRADIPQNPKEGEIDDEGGDKVEDKLQENVEEKSQEESQEPSASRRDEGKDEPLDETRSKSDEKKD